jgi:hypothetical protein
MDASKMLEFDVLFDGNGTIHPVVDAIIGDGYKKP